MTPPEMVRLQKFLAQQGIASRRAIERMIEEGRIVVDGQKAHLGQQVYGTEEILVDGKKITPSPSQKTVWIAFYKPQGVECTLKKSPHQKTLSDYDWGDVRVYPVGRLDKNSEGLLLLTNDGEGALKLTHPRYQHEKEYEVTVDKPLTEKNIEKLSFGKIVLDDTPVLPCEVHPISAARFRIVLREGRNRQIRRMCGACGLTVRKLVRTRVGDIHIGHLKPGEIKHISDGLFDTP